jgi:hypothetical protein
MAEKDEREDDLAKRFPASPAPPEIPDAPKIEVKLPPRAGAPQPGTVAPGGYHKLAVAATAASTFVTPIIVLGVGGWWLDQRLHMTTALFAFIGTVLGFIAGVVGLMRVIQQLNR